MREDAEIITERDGAGIRFVGFANPSPFLARTVTNRNEAYLMLEGHTLDLEMKAGKDPVLRLSPELRFGYMTEAKERGLRHRSPVECQVG